MEWLELTYPAEVDSDASESERILAQERACLSRLETICWPVVPVCPKCGDDEVSKTRWRGSSRGLGYRCTNPECKARFHVLQAVPAMKGTHRQVSIWFRAIFLIDGNHRLSSPALGKALGIDQGSALDLREDVRQLRADNPLLVEGILNGPVVENSTRSRAKKRASSRARKSSGGGGNASA
jgi:Transposase zinc-ribbon domain